MRSSVIFSLSLLCLLLSSCVKNEFIIEAELPAEVTENYRVLYYAADKRGGWITEGTLVVTAGKGKLKGITRLPSIVYLYESGNVPAVAFYARRGDKIKISGQGMNPRDWSFSGNDINKEWSEWRLSERKSLNSPDATNVAVAKYVRANPDKPLALILLLTLYDEKLDTKGFRKLYDSLSPNVRDSEWLRLFNNAALADYKLTEPDGVTTSGFPVMVNPDSMVSLRYADAERMLFFVHGRSEKPSSADIASIRKLLEEKSGDRLRVNFILFTSDSTAISRDHLADSIPGARFYWAPEAEVSPAAVALNVSATPEYIVTDRKGNILYSGSELSGALRKL